MVSSPKRRHYRLTRRTYIMLFFLVALAIVAIIFTLRACKNATPQKPNESSNILSPFSGISGYISGTIFIGDSRTHGLSLYQLVPEANVMAIDGMNHIEAREKKFVEVGGKTLTIKDAVAELKPQRLLVSYGINGMGDFPKETYLSEYRLFLNELKAASPESSLIVQSIYPVSAELSELRPEISNDVIKQYNEQLLKLSEEVSAFFLNTNEVLSLSDGSLDPRYDAGDGLHISPDGYRTILKYIDTHQAN